jgi:hypothetical protein
VLQQITFDHLKNQSQSGDAKLTKRTTSEVVGPREVSKTSEGPRHTNKLDIPKTASVAEGENNQLLAMDDVTRTEKILTTLDDLKEKLQELGDLLLTPMDGSEGAGDHSTGEMRQGGALGISLDATSVLALLTMGESRKWPGYTGM